MDAALSGRQMEYFRPRNRSLYVYLSRYFSWGW